MYSYNILLRPMMRSGRHKLMEATSEILTDYVDMA